MEALRPRKLGDLRPMHHCDPVRERRPSRPGSTSDSFQRALKLRDGAKAHRRRERKGVRDRFRGVELRLFARMVRVRQNGERSQSRHEFLEQLDRFCATSSDIR